MGKYFNRLKFAIQKPFLAGLLAVTLALAMVSSVFALSSSFTLTQSASNTETGVYSTDNTRVGQRFNSFPSSNITAVGFYLKKTGSPTGTGTFNVRRVSDDGVIGAAGTIDVSTLTTGYVLYTKTSVVANPTLQDIRVTFEYSGGDGANSVGIEFQSSDVSVGYLTKYLGGWTDTSTQDCTFTITRVLTYTDPSDAKAPAYSLTTATPFATTPTITGQYTAATISPTYPGASIMTDIANASGTPSQLPFTIVSGVVVIALSLVTTWLVRQYGTNSVFFKAGVIVGIMGILIAVKQMDFWMMIFFAFFAVAILFASKEQGTV